MGITPLPCRASAVRPHGGHLQLLHKKVLQLLGTESSLPSRMVQKTWGPNRWRNAGRSAQHPVRRRKEGIRRRLLRQQHQIAQAKGYIDLPAKKLL